MNTPSISSPGQEQVREILEQWAKATRKNLRDEILKHHAPDVVIYDVLPPMKYEGSEAYRRSWDDWQRIRKAKDNLTCRTLPSSLAPMSPSPIASSDVEGHCLTEKPLKTWFAQPSASKRPGRPGA
jgi:hypothetical protein